MYIPSIEDILGIDQTKLGFFQEWQRKLMELRDAHAESERQRQVTSTILDSITDLMMVLDEDLRIVVANKVLEEMFPERPVVGQYCHMLFRATDKPCPDCPALQALMDDCVWRDTSIFHINGRNCHFDMVASSVPHPLGRGKSVLMVKRDVTLQKQLQAQMYQAEKMASLGVLAAGVAHEINNPLTAIAGFAEGIQRRMPLLQKSLPTELAQDIEEYTNIILQESNRCRDIVQALMNFSRPLPSLRPVVLAHLVEETLSLMRHTLKKYERVIFCLDLAENLPPVWIDDAQVRQVLLNLITNALDALVPQKPGTPAEGETNTITIRTAEEENGILLQVEDTGEGILPTHIGTVFEPFFTTKPKGLGLGLSLCYNVIQTHGGEITLTHTHGKTTATVRLPKGSTAAPQPLPLAAEGA